MCVWSSRKCNTYLMLVLDVVRIIFNKLHKNVNDRLNAISTFYSKHYILLLEQTIHWLLKAAEKKKTSKQINKQKKRTSPIVRSPQKMYNMSTYFFLVHFLLFSHLVICNQLSPLCHVKLATFFRLVVISNQYDFVDALFIFLSVAFFCHYFPETFVPSNSKDFHLPVNKKRTWLCWLFCFILLLQRDHSVAHRRLYLQALGNH